MPLWSSSVSDGLAFLRNIAQIKREYLIMQFKISEAMERTSQAPQAITSQAPPDALHHWSPDFSWRSHVTSPKEVTWPVTQCFRRSLWHHFCCVSETLKTGRWSFADRRQIGVLFSCNVQDDNIVSWLAGFLINYIDFKLTAWWDSLFIGAILRREPNPSETEED